MKRISKNEKGKACFMLHGSIENGRIFYSLSGKGLAPWLAGHGYDVFVADLRGKGKSSPAVGKDATHGQWEAINEDIPAFLDAIRAIKGGEPMHWMAHSWGGVLLLSYLARYHEVQVASLTFFACKRDVRVQNMYRWFNIDLLWNLGGRYLCWRYGFMPMTKYGIGSDNEPRNFFREVNHWVYSHDWVCPRDGFDYGANLQQIRLPPALYLAGAKDTHSGHASDVKRLMQQTGNRKQDKFMLLSKENGNLLDYDHNNILTHQLALEDHFPEVLQWMKQHEKIQKI